MRRHSRRRSGGRAAVRRAGRLQHLPAQKIGTCTPLADQALQEFALSTEQAHVVAVLRNFAAKPSEALLAEVASSNAFAPPQKFAAGDEYADYWFPDPGTKNLECGIHFRYAKEEL